MFTADDSLDTKFTLEGERTGVVDEPPFHILILGDWSGTASRADRPAPRPIEIDRDNFDEVMERLSAGVISGKALAFREIDDFHPDAIYRSLPVFTELRELRHRLRDERTFREAARHVRGSSAEVIASPESRSMDKAEESPAAEGLLDSILAQPKGGAAKTAHISGELSTLISDLVRPHLVGVDEGEQRAMVAAVDAAAGALMRDILHDSEFRELEAAWRGLFLLTRRVETNSDLKIFICDVSKEELIADLSGTGDLTAAVVHRMLVDPVSNEPWALVCGNYAFEPNVGEIAALIRIAQISAKANAPFISHMRPEVFGVATLRDKAVGKLSVSAEEPAGKLWSTLRGFPESEFLGFVMPRFLARAPYGSETDPVETFSFEEFPADDPSPSYVWSNGCFLAATLLAQSFSRDRWDMGRGLSTDLEGLPTHVFRRGGETVFQSAIEAQLSEADCDILAANGFMPLAGFKNSDRVRLVRFQSASDSGRSIRGRWSS